MIAYPTAHRLNKHSILVYDFAEQLKQNPDKKETKSHFGAGEGNRTLVFSLEGCCSTIELHPQCAAYALIRHDLQHGFVAILVFETRNVHWVQGIQPIPSPFNPVS